MHEVGEGRGEGFGQLPCACQFGAELVSVYPDRFLFGLQAFFQAAIRLAQRLAGFLRVMTEKQQVADVVQQPANEYALGIGDPGCDRHSLGQQGAVQAAIPEGVQVHHGIVQALGGL